jgi:primosomal protein N' (replication factor Y)
MTRDGLTKNLLDAIAARLDRNEQSLIFINRRGYAPVLICHACGWAAPCHRCSARLVLHLKDRRLHCHHCGHQERVPATCPDCGNADLAPLGHGTQRIESVLAGYFPDARLLRIDRDSTRRKQAWSDMRRQIHDREVDILVGTQMLAKGHDFPALTLVGVLNADQSLYSTDFRASERLFAQLMQVAGRAGRDRLAGEVLVQTEFPRHPLFLALQQHDYAQFAEQLLDERKQAGFPPFMHQALLHAEANQVEPAFDFLAQAARLAKRLDPHQEVTAYDPVAAPLARLAGKARAQLLVQSASRARLQRFLHAWYGELLALANTKVRWYLDVDPLEF